MGSAGGFKARICVLLISAGGFLACQETEIVDPNSMAAAKGGNSGDTRLVAEGREIFRFDDFGNWRFWTDTLELNDLVETLTPNQALALGLKVDVDAIPPATLQAVLANPALLDDPAITRALLSLNAVLGVTATVVGDQITRLGITCALCHSSVDNPSGIGHRMDGWANTDLEVGKIIASAPGLDPALASEVAFDDVAGSWRVQGGVALYLAGAPNGGFGLCEVCLRKIALCGCRAMCRLRGIQALPRQGAGLEQAARPFVLRRRIRQRGLSTLERGVGDRHRRDRGVHLRVYLAAIQRRDHLARIDAIPDINEHAFETARQLRLDADARSRRERAGNFQRGFNGASRGARDGDIDGRRFCRARCGLRGRGGLVLTIARVQSGGE
jgi:hypothetical protein